MLRRELGEEQIFQVDKGISLRRAALVAGFAYLLNPVSYAEFSILPRLIVQGHIDQTAVNIAAHQGEFLLAIFCYFASATGDVVIAWPPYHLLMPVSRPVAQLMAWFQLVFMAWLLIRGWTIKQPVPQ